MTRAQGTIPPTVLLGAVLCIAALANTGGAAVLTSAAQRGAVVTGVHANEEFCKTMVKQVALLGEFAKLPIVPDMAKRATLTASSRMHQYCGSTLTPSQ